MNTVIFLTAILGMATSYPLVKTWTLSQLSDAIQNKTDPILTPYLEEALNQIMLALFTGTDLKLVHAVIPSPSGGATWSVEELKIAVEDRHLPNDHKIAIMQALDIVKQRNATGELLDSIEVAIPAMDVSLWTSIDLNEALRSPSTKPELIPYLEKARSELKECRQSGNLKDTIGMVTPVGLIPHKVNYEFIPKVSKRFVKKTKKGL